jgi:hypothetical protein
LCAIGGVACTIEKSRLVGRLEHRRLTVVAPSLPCYTEHGKEVIQMIKSQTLEAVWDMIPTLAVQVLAAKHDLSTMSYPDMLNELNNIMGDLFAAADETLPTVSK